MDKRLLQKYISGDASEEEVREVIEWIMQSDENKREYITRRKLFDISIWRDQPVEETRETHKVYFTKTWIIKIASAAAVIAFVVAGSYFYISGLHLGKAEQMQSLYVPAGQRSEVMLADGTKVWLNSGSKLTFPGTFEGKYRKVKLDGEGYFIVTKNKEKPFIVETNRYDIKVLGTVFNVTAYSSDNTWRTSLLRGSVEIDTPQGNIQMKLVPNTMATYDGKRLVEGMIENNDYYNWRDGLICFDNVSVKEMIEKLELCYGVKIVIKNKRMLSEHYTGKFRVNDGIDQVLNVLKLDNKFTYHKDDDKNLIVIN
jgi:transmembrane sensor